MQIIHARSPQVGDTGKARVREALGQGDNNGTAGAVFLTIVLFNLKPRI
jgi:hypothetical protein